MGYDFFRMSDYSHAKSMSSKALIMGFKSKLGIQCQYDHVIRAILPSSISSFKGWKSDNLG